MKVGKLDKTFKESMNSLQKEFKKIYPLMPFTTKIEVDNLVENRISSSDPKNDTGLLYSGGVDSTYTLMETQHLNPKLVMMWGVDDFPYPKRADHWEKAVTIYQKFAERKKLQLHILKTNISQILNLRRITHRYHKELYDGSVRTALQHSLVLLPPAAPLSVGRFSKFLIAASGSPPYNPIKPRAARPWLDEKIIWADLNLETHGCIPRKDKIFRLAEYMKEENITLRICLNSKLFDGELNYCNCSKCLLTIAQLVITGVDPNICGFKVDESTFVHMKAFVMSKKSLRLSQQWYGIKELLRNGVDFEVPGSKEFFKWLRDFDLVSAERNWFYSDLYMAFPYFLAKNLERVYYKMGIRVHEEPYKRE